MEEPDFVVTVMSYGYTYTFKQRKLEDLPEWAQGQVSLLLASANERGAASIPGVGVLDKYKSWQDTPTWYSAHIRLPEPKVHGNN